MRRQLHAEWTKLRTLRGWVFAIAAAAGAMLALGLLPGLQGSCGQHGPGSECVLPVGPDGLEVSDSFTFLHQAMTGDGALTARITSLTGVRLGEGGETEALAPWAKAGLIIKDGTSQGSAYAAVMLTGAHGVRMQHNYLHDIAGPKTGTHQWLRLTRTGQRVTGQASPDGASWETIATVELPKLSETVQIGLFVTSPQYAEPTTEQFGANGAMGGPTRASATFDQLDRAGGWSTLRVGGSSNFEQPGIGSQQTQTGFALTGSGDIAPAVAGAAGAGFSITQTLVGTFAALLLMTIVGVGYITGEYRRGMIRTTLTASPRRGRVLAAKAIVLGGVTFAVGLAAAAVVVTFGQKVLRDNGAYVLPAGTGTQLRVIAGTGVLLAVASVLALALGALLRRSATAVTAAVVTIVLPYLLAMTVLPAGAAQWLLRVTPAAAFALQQSAVEYHQVANLYTPVNGFFPLPPWAGLAVLAAWTAAALTVASLRLNRNDA
jgi:ABC-type transport system involved in multi-copper enzyme maturation permease subunit